jgi:hypothetical protein
MVLLLNQMIPVIEKEGCDASFFFALNKEARA